MEEGESKIEVTSSGVQLKPGKAKEVAKEETILNWFSPEDQDTELGEVFRTEIWAHPAVLDAYENGDEGDESSVDTSKPQRTSSSASLSGLRSGGASGGAEADMDTLAAIQAAWADSDPESPNSPH